MEEGYASLSRSYNDMHFTSYKIYTIFSWTKLKNKHLFYLGQHLYPSCYNLTISLQNLVCNQPLVSSTRTHLTSMITNQWLFNQATHFHLITKKCPCSSIHLWNYYLEHIPIENKNIPLVPHRLTGDLLYSRA